MTTRKQHYVWRHYLEAWQDDKNLVQFSRNGKLLRPTNPKNLMVERDFYRLPYITRADAEFLKAFIQLTEATELRTLHLNLLSALEHISNANEKIQSIEGISDNEKRFAQKIVIEIEENLQGRIEQEAMHLS